MGAKYKPGPLLLGIGCVFREPKKKCRHLSGLEIGRNLGEKLVVEHVSLSCQGVEEAQLGLWRANK